MTTVFVLTFVSMMCTISIAWGCVTGAGPSWEVGQSGIKPGRRGKMSSRKPGVIGPGGPLGEGPTRPRIPVEVMRYFGGMVSKETAFASIDLDVNGQVSFVEWMSEGGAMTEFNHMLLRLDTNGDNLISLAELQPFSLPASSNTDILPRNLPGDLPGDLPRNLPRNFPGNFPRDLPRDFPRRLVYPRRNGPRGPRGPVRPRELQQLQ